MPNERDDELVRMMNTYPPPQEPEKTLDIDLLERRLRLTPAQRLQNMANATRLANRLLKRIREKYALDFRLQ
jgi:hypothetical protein